MSDSRDYEAHYEGLADAHQAIDEAEQPTHLHPDMTQHDGHYPCATCPDFERDAVVLRRDVQYGVAGTSAWLVTYRDQIFVISTGSDEHNPVQVFRADNSGRVRDWDEVASGDTKDAALAALVARPVDETGHVLSPRDVLDAAEAAEDEDRDQQRDYAEEAYNRDFCIPCGASPCTWDGQPDGFHTDEPADAEAETGTCANCGCGTAEPQHADYPHEPGRLYDCPACEASCHCTPGYTQCVYSGEHNGTADDGTERHETAESRSDALVRDEAGEPVRQLIERDSQGQYITPRYGFVWKTR
jgi:hypothetical protein